MVKVSVIIPVYNSEKYIVKCLESVRNQTLAEIEIICVDDCSTDSSRKLLEDYVSRDERIRLLHNEKNMGLSFTRNRALEEAAGEYVQFLDSDDYLYANDTLEILYSIASADNLDLLKSQVLLLKNDVLKTYFQYPACIIGNIYSGRELLYHLEYYDVCARVAYSNFVRLDFIKEHKISFYHGILHEDILFSYELYECAKRAMCVRQNTYVYVKYENTITTRQKSAVHLEGHLVCMNEILKKDIKHSSMEFRYATIKYLIRIYTEIISISQKLNACVEKEMLGESLGNLYEMLQGKSYVNLETIGKSMDAIAQSRKLYIYGAGNAAKELLKILIERDIAIDGVFVTDTANSNKNLLGHRVLPIDDCDCRNEDALFLVAITAKYVGNVVELLHNKGYDNVIYVC